MGGRTSRAAPITDERFQPKGKPKVEMLMAKHAPVEKPFLTRPWHSSVTQLAEAAGAYGFAGQLFLAEFGDMGPLVGQCPIPGATASTASIFPPGATAGLKRPVDLVFSPSGRTLYVVDLGVFAVPPTAAPMPMPKEGTGVVWRVHQRGVPPEGPPAGLSPLPG